MADLFNKHIKKATSRTKEKLLEGIGKAKATQDEVFDSHANNLTKQAKSCERLQKDIKTYCSALKALCQAERTLRDTIRDSYETEWPEREHLTALLDNLDIQTNELEKAMGEDLIQSVSHYVAQFGDLKKKVDKRGRKLVDYDHAKNTYNSLKASSKKVESDPKVAKALVELQQAEGLYKEMNSELLEILPATYDSRITFFVDTLQTMFNAHSVNQTECSRLNKQVVTQLDKLGQSMDFLRVPRIESRALTPIDTATEGGDTRESTPSPASSTAPTPARNSVVSIPTPSPAPPSTPAGGGNPFDEDEDGHKEKEEEEVCQNKVYPKLNATPKTTIPAEEVKKEENKDEKSTNPFDDSDEEKGEEKEEMCGDRKVNYRVISTHEYKAVDSDELSFGPGEEIMVLVSNETDLLDDGWQMGEKKNGERGVFPENFTKKKTN